MGAPLTKEILIPSDFTPDESYVILKGRGVKSIKESRKGEKTRKENQTTSQKSERYTDNRWVENWFQN